MLRSLHNKPNLTCDYSQQLLDLKQKNVIIFKILCYLQKEKIWVVTCLQKANTCTELQAEQILSVKT